MDHNDYKFVVIAVYEKVLFKGGNIMMKTRKAKLWQRNIWKVCCCMILAVTAGLFVGAGVSVSAAEKTGDDVVVLDVSKKIDIYADGYTYAGGNKVSHTGRYILTGTGSDEVNFLGENTSYDVTMRNLTMESPKLSGQSAIKVADGVTLNLQIEGTNSVTASNHPGIQLNVAETDHANLNITLKRNSSLSLNAVYSYSKSFADNITVNVDNKNNDVQGVDKLNTRSEELNLTKGTPQTHGNYIKKSIDDTYHQEICPDCDARGIIAKHMLTDAENGKTCEDCGYNDTVAVLDVGKGRIDISPDGYTYNEGSLVPHKGKYILMGNGQMEVNFAENSRSYDVTVRNLTMQSESWKSIRSALKLEDGVMLNLHAEGINSITAANHPGIQSNNEENGYAIVNITLKKDSSLKLDSFKQNSGSYDNIKSFAKGITAIVDGENGAVQGIDKLDNRTEALNLSKGTPKTHEYKWIAVDASQHQEVCNDCDSKGIKIENHVWEDAKTEAGHGQKCTACGYTTTEEAHTYGDMTYTETGHSQSCTICNYVKNNPHNFITTESGQQCKDCGYKKENTSQKDDDKKNTDTDKKDNNKKNPTSNTSQKVAPAKGTNLADKKSGVTYVVTAAGKEVSYKKPNSKKKSVVIPDKITINGYTYKVTSIADNAFKNNKKITSVTIGKNIKRIGKKAFFGCKNVKKITVKTTLLKSSTVGSKAFTKAGSKNYKKLKVTLPKKKAKSYLKIFRKKGLKK